jgi:hypothetical protein
MKNVLIWTAAASLFAAQPLLAQRAPSRDSLAGARAFFELADFDKDGKLGFDEMQKQGLTVQRSQFDAMDVDKSGSWSRDEFVVYYRRLLIASQHRPAADLSAEVTRIEALRKAKEAETRRPVPETKPGEPSALSIDDRLQIAINELELKAAQRQATRAEFQHVRDLMVERAKVAGATSASDAPDLQAKFDAAMTALETKAKAGNYSREDFNELRAMLIQRARASTQTPAANAGDVDVKLQAALDDLEKKAALRQASRADFDRVRDMWTERAKSASAQDPAATVELKARFDGAMSTLEAQAKQGNYSREEFGALRALLIQHGREAANGTAPVQGANASDLDARLQSALDDLERKAQARQATREDFNRVRETWIARAKAATAGETGAAAAQTSALAQQFAAAMDELEKNALAGNWSPEQFAAIQQSYIHRARAASGGAQPAPVPSASSSGSVQQRFDEALDTLQAHALASGATREDYQRLKDQLVARARESVSAADATAPVSADDPRVTALAAKLGAAIDQLEEQARAGKITRADFDKFRQMLVHRARAAVSATDAPAGDAGATPASTSTPKGPGSRATEARTPQSKAPESKGPASGRGAEKEKQPRPPAPVDPPKPDDGSGGREKPPPRG